jgi:acetyl-CoA C-acetyltransferase
MFSERLGLFKENEGWKAVDERVTYMDGDLPINSSGGVLSTNAVGSSAMQRVAEAALQIMGKAGEHQVPKDVHNAVATGWGAVTNFFTLMVLGDEPRK